MKSEDDNLLDGGEAKDASGEETPCQLEAKEEDLPAKSENGLKTFASDYKQLMRKADPDADPNENFTWEHFFVEHCGILPCDAGKYEKALIAHRMDPLDTLLESLGLIIEYGRIPIGDKLKISKAIESKKKDIKSADEAMENAREAIGLGEYNQHQASMIMGLAGGESEYHIDYGIEQYESHMEELKRITNIQMVKDPRIAENYKLGASLGRLTKDPTLQFLRSFGYETFEYTKNKHVTDAAVHSCPTSSDPVVETLLLGNMGLDSNDRASLPENMYS